MEISDVRVKLMRDAADRLKAVCSITLDGEFVVRDLKVVDGTNGLFVAMPSRKLCVHCPQCKHKNHLRAQFCNDCGAKLPPHRVAADANGRVRLHRDIAHPINPSFRETVQSRVIAAFETERELAKSPDYQPADLDAESDDLHEINDAGFGPTEYDTLIAGLKAGHEAPSADVERRPGPPSRPQNRPMQRPASPHGAQGDRRGGPPRNAPGRRPEASPAGSTPRPARNMPSPTESAALAVVDEITEAIRPGEEDVQRPRPAAVAVRPPPRPAPVRETPRTDPPRTAATSTAKPDEDEAPFGMGLL